MEARLQQVRCRVHWVHVHINTVRPRLRCPHESLYFIKCLLSVFGVYLIIVVLDSDINESRHQRLGNDHQQTVNTKTFILKNGLKCTDSVCVCEFVCE